jgi:hypothetical protein
MWALLIDDVEAEIDADNEPFLVLRLSDLDLPEAEIHRMALLFSGKLIAVIKPWVFDHFLRRGADQVLYIDGDFVLFDSLQGVSESAGDGVILIPHLLHPLPRDGRDPNETSLMGAGMFNAGMFGTGPNHGGFIEFLQERLRRECIFDAPKMRFNEQRWLDFVPSLFPHHIVRDPGVDVAYWNLHERPLEKKDGIWFAGGSRLKAFHFSSFDPRTRGVGGRFELDPAPRVTVSGTPGFAELLDGYRGELLDSGFEECHDLPFAFDALADGAPVYESLRTLFTDAVLAADEGQQPYPPDPFSVEEVQEFRAWRAQHYARAGLDLPRRLAATPSEAIRPLQRIRNRFKGREPLPVGGTDTRWVIDWLNRMIVDPAAERTSTGFQVYPQRVGFVCHGPRAPIGAGFYRVTLEWQPSAVPSLHADAEQVLVVEGFVDGYVVGSRSVDLAEIVAGTVQLDVEIPERYQQAALLFGLEVRVLSRGGVDATLTAVLFEALGDVEDVPKFALMQVDWLPVMAGGNAGQRDGREVTTISGRVGTVVLGPNWRLVPGRYHVDMGVRLLTDVDSAAHGLIASAMVTVGDQALTEVALSAIDLATGVVRLEFVISEAEARGSDQVGVSLRIDTPIDVAVTSVIVECHEEAALGAVTVG